MKLNFKKLLLGLFSIILLMLMGCQNVPETVNPQATPQSTPGIPYSKGPTNPPDKTKGPSAPPGENASISPPAAITETDNVRITIPPVSP